MRRPWQPVPALKASALLHGAAAVTSVVEPALWPWALGAIVADHAVLTAGCLLPRSTLLGPNWRRLPAAASDAKQMALTFDDGPHPVFTPQILDLLDRYTVKATFFCIGQRARAYPAIVRDIVARGHAVENHSEHHSSNFSLLGPRTMRAEITQAQMTLTEITGRAPRFFRPKAGIRNLFLDPVLHGLNLHLVSWSRRAFDTRQRDSAVIVQRLTRNLSAGDILLLHDGNAALTADGQSATVQALPYILQAILDAGLQPVRLDQAIPFAHDTQADNA